MLNIIIFGGPGSGKGTQSERIAERFGLFHISTGEVLRDHIARKTDLGKVAHSYISKGLLIPDKLMLKVLSTILEEHPQETAAGVIFDGFPRTLAQAEALDKMLQEHGTAVSTVIGLEVPDEELMARMIKRGADTGRADDNEATIKSRLAVYHKQTEPLKEFYESTARYTRIDGHRSIDGIFDEICGILDHMV